MKSFIAALVLLSLAVSFTVGNAIILEHRFGKLLQMAEALPETPADSDLQAASELQSYLKKHGKYMALTVRSSVLKSLDELITQAAACIEGADEAGYKFALESLKKQLKTAKTAEKASFGNFF